MPRCGVCFEELGNATSYAHPDCWRSLNSAGQIGLIRQYARIISEYEAAHVIRASEGRTTTMARREVSSSEGTKAPVVSDDETMEKFKLSTDDYNKLPMLCKTALKDALTMTANGTGATNLWLVHCTDYDGNQQCDIAVAANGRDALRAFASYHDYDEETDFDSAPTAYRLPSEAPFGMMRYTGLEEARWSELW